MAAATTWEYAEALKQVLDEYDARCFIGAEERTITYQEIADLMKRKYNVDIEPRLIIGKLREDGQFYERAEIPGAETWRHGPVEEHMSLRTEDYIPKYYKDKGDASLSRYPVTNKVLWTYFEFDALKRISKLHEKDRVRGSRIIYCTDAMNELCAKKKWPTNVTSRPTY